jgi:hypothetical protein
MRQLADKEKEVKEASVKRVEGVCNGFSMHSCRNLTVILTWAALYGPIG